MGFCDALLFQSNPLWIWITQIMINTQRANKRDDQHDILRTFVDDPNNEVKTVSYHL